MRPKLTRWIEGSSQQSELCNRVFCQSVITIITVTKNIKLKLFVFVTTVYQYAQFLTVWFANCERTDLQLIMFTVGEQVWWQSEQSVGDGVVVDQFRIIVHPHGGDMFSFQRAQEISG